MPKFKVAYGNKDKIADSINSGRISPGSLIITRDTRELYFYDNNSNLEVYKEKYKFNSMEEATNWINCNDCRGEIISVHEEDICNIYVVGYDNQLRLATDDTIPDWNASPEEPGYIKNKPAKMYVHEQRVASSEWKISHNLDKIPNITVIDSANNLVIGDIEYIDMNNIVLRFKGLFSGKCYLN